MELLQLRYFCHAAHTGNFSKAAEELGIPQPAISRTIATLEKELGCKLFDRTGKRVTLNEQGKFFLHEVEKSLHGLDQAILQLSQSREKTIKLQVLAATKLIPNLLVDFSTENPHVKFVLHQHPGEKDYDLRITARERAPENNCRILMSEQVVLAVPREHRLYNRDVIDVEELRNERFVGLAKHKDLRTLIDAYCARHGFSPNIAFEAENAATFRSLVEQHLGIAFVPEKVFRSSPSEGLHMIPLRDYFERTIILEWKESRLPDKQTREFCDFAVDWFVTRMLSV